MFALKLARLIENHADELSEGLMRKLKTSGRCSELISRDPDQLKRRTRDVYANLTDWLMTEPNQRSRRDTSDRACGGPGRACLSASSFGRSVQPKNNCGSSCSGEVCSRNLSTLGVEWN